MYVGQSHLAPGKRSHDNEIAQLVPKSNRLSKILHEHGGSQFVVIELEKFKIASEADESQEFWIQNLETRNPLNGYNTHSNKSIKKKKDPNDMESTNIRKMFLTGDYSVKDLSHSYKINNKSITQIIDAKGYLDEAPEFDIELEQKEVIKNPKVLMDEFGMEFDTVDACAEYYDTSHEEIMKKIRNKKSSDKRLPSIFWFKPNKLVKKL